MINVTSTSLLRNARYSDSINQYWLINLRARTKLKVAGEVGTDYQSFKGFRFHKFKRSFHWSALCTPKYSKTWNFRTSKLIEYVLCIYLHNIPIQHSASARLVHKDQPKLLMAAARILIFCFLIFITVYQLVPLVIWLEILVSIIIVFYMEFDIYFFSHKHQWINMRRWCCQSRRRNNSWW